MALNHYELSTEDWKPAVPNSSLQEEANAERFGAHKAHTGLASRFEHVIDDIPTPVAQVASFATAFCPDSGALGLVGKTVAGAVGLAYAADAALRISDGEKLTSSSVFRDGSVLASLALGRIAAPGFRSLGTSEAMTTEAVAKTTGDKLASDWTEIPKWAEGTNYPAAREEFFNSIKGLNAADQATVKDALSVAEDAHMGQLRQVHIGQDFRDPFIIHPVRTATILTKELGSRDPQLISAALLHDTVEDSEGKYTIDSLRARFGSRVADTVKGVTKPPKINGVTPDLGPYYAGIETGPEDVKLIKLADRLDNIRDTIELPNPKFQARYLDETATHYLPLAQRTNQFFYNNIKTAMGQVASALQPA